MRHFTGMMHSQVKILLQAISVSHIPWRVYVGYSTGHDMIESLRSKVELLEVRLETVSEGEGGRHLGMVWAQKLGFIGALSQLTAPTSAL